MTCCCFHRLCMFRVQDIPYVNLTGKDRKYIFIDVNFRKSPLVFRDTKICWKLKLIRNIKLLKAGANWANILRNFLLILIFNEHDPCSPIVNYFYIIIILFLFIFYIIFFIFFKLIILLFFLSLFIIVIQFIFQLVALLIVWCSDMGKVVFVLLFCLFCFLSLSVSCCVLVGVCFFFFLSFFFFLGGGRGLGWVVLFKVPWSIYLMLFRVTNLSALLLPYFTVMLFLLLHGSGNQLVFVVFFFFFFFFLFQCWSFWEWCPFPCFLIHLGFFPFPSIVFQST